ncbi:MAG: CsbD family protein [Xanthomonadaceae bacterium]|nr:CsbD family protein [Xanthomonadaceae bacterium]MDE1964071.1 CsbD family protein [Xanthomonadaceae bacterium]
MNHDTIEGQWKQLTGALRQQWGKLTDDDLSVARGDSEYLAGKLQQRYGIARDEAEAKVRAFEKQLRH